MIPLKCFSLSSDMSAFDTEEKTLFRALKNITFSCLAQTFKLSESFEHNE